MENENSSDNTMEPPLKRRKGDDELKYRQLYYSRLDHSNSRPASRKKADRTGSTEHSVTARGGEKRGGVLRQRDESARTSGAGREERALDFSGVPSLETRGTFEATSLEVSGLSRKFSSSVTSLNGNIKIGDLCFEEVEKFKYLGATVTNINDNREEIKRRINMGTACYYSVEKLLSSSLLSKYLKVKIYKTVILPIVLYGCETRTLTLREEQRLKMFENKFLRKIFGAKRDEDPEEWRKDIWSNQSQVCLEISLLNSDRVAENTLEEKKTVDIGYTSTYICLTWSQATKGNIEGEEFGPVLWIEFGVAQWAERLVRRTKDPGYDGWINFENETQDRQEWRNAICEREGKDSGFSYDL
ncbi:hypothetical protein ANN_00794 [Periplaneta americana]|uniref:Uncharacterized protein n=1 Tax=Periplaneta americana TaxID=6978 RepID=A0ABQ8TRV1_PERAM|nr:hypothetical protein ANN_00794 [Periplaneta americana]